jgi:Zn-dependent M16 (insulinase) family peptidase
MHGQRLLALLVVLAACHPTPAASVPAPPMRGSDAVAPPSGPEPTLETLAPGAKSHGFTAVAQYLDDAGKPVGARFTHDATGFTFDVLRIESAPQGFLWVNSFPTSDKGEPHTQEHLLLGKGDRGRRLGNNEAMALAESSAFTEQWRTCYHFHTVAGNDVFWPVFEGELDALLHPDYTDEEVRREVRNFGVDKADDGTLRLEEKGTVYNEMVRTYENPDVALWREAGLLVYGAHHPLAYESGGYPAAIRTMTPADIRKFHDDAYHLANMGMVGAFPSSLALGPVLAHTDAILTKMADHGGHATREADLPKPAPAAGGTIQVVEYPYSDSTNPGPLLLAWPANRQLDATERTLASLFLDAFAGDESTLLYKKLIDGKTRVMDLGASGVWSNVSTDEGQPLFVGVNGVKADKLDGKTVDQVRALVMAELARLAKLPDGDPELVAFDARVQSRVVDLRRKLAKFLDTPPGFGFRGTGSSWISHLHELDKTPGFQKSLTMRPELAAVEQILAQPQNPWRERVHAWGLDQQPFGIAARPSPAVRTQLDVERKQRNDAELARLQTQYGAKDAATTLARYQQDYDAATQKLEASAKAVELPPLVATPPMSLDEGLHYETGEVAGVRSLVATFDSMASARVQLAFSVIGAVAPDEQFLLAALPTLIEDAGVIDAGKPISADEMHERMRKEILELSIHYSTNPHTGRVELVVAGAGNGADETKAALAWMRRVMLSPDWRIDNLPRLRDLVDQELTSLRERTLGAEEGWVDDPPEAWRMQASLEYLHTSSFLTRAHDLHRLRWMLLDPRDAAAQRETVSFLGELASASKLSRADLSALAAALAGNQAGAKGKPYARWTDAAHKLSAKAAPLAREAGKDLAALLPDLPDGSLAADWQYLCRQMAHDLGAGAPAALARLEDVRRRVIEAGNARLVEVGSTANQGAIAGDVTQLAKDLPSPKTGEHFGHGSTTTPLLQRLDDRREGTREPMFVGLVDPATSSGVFVNLVSATSYSDTEDDKLLDYLAANLYSGHGAHSMFMKTWAAGLAYSNGLHPNLEQATLDYYAERCPLLPQTLRFVIDQLHAARPDPNLVRYALATAFTSRIANDFESRASEMAADLVDGETPDLVRGFRTHLLELGKRADLAQTLFTRMPAVYGKVLPGFGAIDPRGVYFVIGPESQLAAYEEYLRAAVGKDTRLHRIYPRDFWIPVKL